VAHISQPGRVGSLNAAVATAIAMAEAPEGLSRTTQPFSEPEELTHYSIAYQASPGFHISGCPFCERCRYIR
jgi:hypothetical protein